MKLTSAVVALLAVAGLSSCGPPARDTAAADEYFKQKWDAWYQQQVALDCVPGPYDDSAIQTVQRAQKDDAKQFVYGERDPYDRRAKALSNLKTKPNPKGEGILVTAWEDDQRGASVNWSRARSVWLVLDKRVYPVNQNAANALGRLYGGMPANVQKRAGLVHTYERGHRMMDQLGLEEETLVRSWKHDGSNPFTTCR
jgi:hypothetical protein